MLTPLRRDITMHEESVCTLQNPGTHLSFIRCGYGTVLLLYNGKVELSIPLNAEYYPQYY